eukprot:4221194-Prymnesium_polylepis.1
MLRRGGEEPPALVCGCGVPRVEELLALGLLLGGPGGEPLGLFVVRRRRRILARLYLGLLLNLRLVLREERGCEADLGHELDLGGRLVVD